MLHRFALCLAAALAACAPASAPDAALPVAIVGAPEDLAQDGLRLSPAAQQLRAATAQGLVRLDETGEVVAGVAQSWIVTNDGLSYIFRLRNTSWPDGEELTAQQVRRQLLSTIRELRGTSLGRDLAKVAEVRALTSRVVEIELSSPQAQFLRVLAQPELGLVRDGQGLGPLRRAEHAAGQAGTTLLPVPPRSRGLPEEPRWDELARPLRLRTLPARDAVAAFNAGQVAVVLGGDLASLPLLDTGPLARGTVRIDQALGLFGFDVVRTEGFLAEPENREALAMAIDRTVLLEPFNLAGWIPATRIVPPNLPGNPRQNAERWGDLDLAARRAIAAGRVARWQAAQGEIDPIAVRLPPGPGSDLVFRQVAADLAAVGLPVRRAGDAEAANLVLRDRIARYGQARWFMNQFHCSVEPALCSAEADEMVDRAVSTLNPQERAALLSRAEDVLTTTNLFIPLGAPVRWSLVRGGVTGFAENIWAAHPLFPLSGAPI
ncbi:ABC transporter substrate-binding protein [Porphyrobacter sp. GA68]|uniref:ABC transporter substrate-binding protein n=1 Tax=Porphyrobacter sp. GA68 TaxID=2883480 RepID=UPI001D189EED|nr:ABC transporter substrate-binding protein [Porphyrobacter sp. GA68]